MYFECVTCPKIGTVCDGPNFLAMSSLDLLEWCKQRKALLRWTNAKLADESNVPKGTIDRLFSATPMDFKFETIRPILKALVGGSWGENPCGATDDSSAEPLLNRITELEEENFAYKERVSRIDGFYKNEMDFYRGENRRKVDFLIKELGDSKVTIKVLRRVIIALGILSVVLLLLIIAALVADGLMPDRGFFWLG